MRKVLALSVSLCLVPYAPSRANERYCTRPEMSAEGFFGALMEWRNRIKSHGEDMSFPSLEFKKNIQGGARAGLVHAGRVQVDNCSVKVIVKAQDPSDGPLKVPQGLRKSFANKDNLEVWAGAEVPNPGPRIDTLYIDAEDFKLRVETRNAKRSAICTALQIIKGMSQLGISAKFLSALDDPNCASAPKKSP